MFLSRNLNQTTKKRKFNHTTEKNESKKKIKKKNMVVMDKKIKTLENEETEIKENENVNEKEDKRRYCYCQKRYDPQRPMICCDNCEEWYHFDCIDEDMLFWTSEENQNLSWKCGECGELRDSPKDKHRNNVKSMFLDIEAEE